METSFPESCPRSEWRPLGPVSRLSKSKMADKERCVGEISAFLSQSAGEMETILHKLKWNKDKLLKEVWKSKSKLQRSF